MIRIILFISGLIVLLLLSCNSSNKDNKTNPKDSIIQYKPTQIIFIFEDVRRKSEENIRNYKATITPTNMNVKVYNAYRVFHDTTFILPENFFHDMVKSIDSLKLHKKEEIIESGCDSGKNYKIKLFDNHNQEILNGYAYYCGKLAAGNLSADPRPLFEKLKKIHGFEQLIKQ
ncbi:MAG: hypothetical protein N2Z72_03630 [Bacteroidales bacterium]|nr:hypothetical protein [Bacteroidales bacterium]